MEIRSIPPNFRRISRHLITVALVFIIASLAAAQSRNSISGFVFTHDRRSVGNIPVELLNDFNQVLQRTRTDGSGKYFFSGMAAGRYTVRVLPLGTNYEEQSQDVEVINIPRPGGASSDSAFKDFYLRLRKNGPDVGPVVGTVLAQEVPDRAQRLYESGISTLDKGQKVEGMKLLLEAVEVFPEYYAALERLGTEYMRRKEYETARAVFTKMVSVDQRSFSGWYGLASAALVLKQFEIAAQGAEKAAGLDGSSYQVFLLLGTSYRHLKNFGEAERSLLKAKELANGASADVHWNLALLYGNDVGKYSEAASELELYLKLVPRGEDTKRLQKLIAAFREKAAVKK